LSSSSRRRCVTKPIGAYPVTSFVVSGMATLELYLRALGEAHHPVIVCTYLFRRTNEITTAGVTTWTDVTIDSDSFLISDLTADSWQEQRIGLSFPAATVAASDRFGLAVSIDRNGTPANTVQVLYDHPHPDFGRSRLEVVTSTPLGE
jgi:hypothetical protein